MFGRNINFFYFVRKFCVKDLMFMVVNNFSSCIYYREKM